MKKIEINWEGPFSIKNIEKFDTDIDYGIYQLYGTHNIFGPNTLLYIGQANELDFSTELAQQKDWFEWEYSEIEIFIGRLGGVTKKKYDELEKEIFEALVLLIYYSSPPYNIHYLDDYGDIEDTLVLNFGKKNRLPLEISTYWNDSEFWDKNNIWEIYKM